MVLNDNPNLSMASRTYMLDAAHEVVQIHSSSPQGYQNDSFDDVFGSAPSSPSALSPSTSVGNTEISDIPRIKEKHETEGYRDGVTKGKAETVQKGFDEGYILGAVIGLRIGRILGLLEGIRGALKDSDAEKKDKRRVGLLLGTAKEELKTESVFGTEYWGEDGIWKYNVTAENGADEVVFTDVASAHPLIKRWEDIVDGEVKRWNLDLNIMGQSVPTDLDKE